MEFLVSFVAMERCHSGLAAEDHNVVLVSPLYVMSRIPPPKVR
jgi:hypothetical protein